MTPVESAIWRTRRDLTFAAVLKVALLATGAASLLLAPAISLSGAATFAMMAGVWILWMALNYHSLKSSRLAAASPLLIASGDYDAAEAHLDASLRMFSIFRAGKLQALQYLALLRREQRRWSEAAQLCRAVLKHRAPASSGIAVRARLILAQSLLAMDDLPGAQEAILGFYREKLGLMETLEMLIVQSDYQLKAGQWHDLMNEAAGKLELTELMASQPAALVQASIALGAKRLGRMEWATFFRGRAELLGEPAELIARRPILAELWGDTRSQEAPQV